MSKTSYSEFEIIGFEGTVVVECEAVLPIVRHTDKDLFTKYSISKTVSITDDSDTDYQKPVPSLPADPVAMFNRSEIETLANEGRLTFLPRPVPAFEGAMVIYVTARLLEVIEDQLLSNFDWQELQADAWVACNHKSKIDALMNHWGEILMNKSTDLLEKVISTQNKQYSTEAERVTDIALCAAEDKTLRARIYLRSGLSIIFSDIPERLDNLYQLIIRHEFKDWSWEDFRTRLNRLAEIMKLRVSLQDQGQSEGSALKKVIQLSSNLNKIDNVQERYAECENIAMKYREMNPTTVEEIHRTAFIIRGADKLRLDKKLLTILKGEPIFYYSGKSLFQFPHNFESFEETPPLLRSTAFLEAAQELARIGFRPGDVAGLALSTHWMGRTSQADI